MNSVLLESDEVLIARLRDDDQGAFTELYDRYWQKIFALAVARLRQPQAAEDCTQEIFQDLWSRRHVIEVKHSLKQYLASSVKYRIIKRMAKQHLINKRVEKFHKSSVEQTSLPTLADFRLYEKELRIKLNSCISNLPTKCQLAFKLHLIEGMSRSDIAAAMNISERTVHVYLTNGMKEIKSNFGSSAPTIMVILMLFRLISKN